MPEDEVLADEGAEVKPEPESFVSISVDILRTPDDASNPPPDSPMTPCSLDIDHGEKLTQERPPKPLTIKARSARGRRN